ncbi:MAG: 23S rRNA (uracil(1939)-C(5))-methyltransferase RlmD [Clostridia bacterium]|nr:23S rRNA (uracil(1939)-C(5))-methyltransferase RlmD [Clostridia bacterium]
MSIQKNQEVKLYIDGITTQGWGVGHIDGFAIFVANTTVGDTIIAHIIKAKKKYAIAIIREILIPSANRHEPDCPAFSQCGGCVYRHITYGAELKIKHKQVEDALLRIGHIDIIPQPIIPAKNIDAYRNKAQYPVGFDGELKIGFFAPNSHRIVNCRECKLQPQEFTTALQIFDDFISKNNISIYNEKENSGLLRHIYLRKADATGEILACAVINGKELPNAESLAKDLSYALPKLKGFLININKSDTNVVLGQKSKLIWGQDYITDILCGCKFRISALSFYQVNASQAQNLYEKAQEYAQLDSSDVLLDLYCGTGTIGISMASKVKKLVGVEIIEQAVQDAKINAALNGIENAIFICGDAADAAKQLKEDGERPSVVLVDPPRKGLTPELISTIVELQPKRIVYISCDPATLARDCELFEKSEYKVQQVTPVDMFPRTAHVETVVLLSHKNADTHINVNVEFGEGDGKIPVGKIAEKAGDYRSSEKVTYKMIQEYVESKYGFKVHTAYIAEVKRDLGLPMFDAPNAVEELKNPRKHPTSEKVEAIKDALKYFEVI